MKRHFISKCYNGLFKRTNENLFLILVLVILFGLPQGCSAGQEVVFSGSTMGTTYRIKVVTGYFKRTSGLQEKIDTRLSEINHSMSTYLEDSEISRFNRWGNTDKAFKISNDFKQVMLASQKVFELTQGAWDATVKPLVDLWGFGNKGRVEQPPVRVAIEKRLQQVGFDNIEWSGSGDLKKRQPTITLDFASIAKGYAVDQVAQLTRSQGIDDFIVEIGGEVFASGKRKDGGKWRVGVNRPSRESSLQDVYKVVFLTNQAMATSGDYRNYFEKDGVVYSHIIDPRTGYPVQNGVISVTIISENCTLADGLATAIMVMGIEKGLALIERLAGVEGLIIVRNAEDEFKNHLSSGFPLTSR